MFSKISNTLGAGYIAITEFQRAPLAFVQKLERGDADSSGSTLRTIGIVVLIVAVVGLLGAAVYAAAGTAASTINNGSTFSFN